jgi:hypothetical protein
MAKKQLVMRVGALALMGGAMALYAAQAGVLPGLDLGTQSATPGAVQPAPAAQPPAALASVLQAPGETDHASDTFVRTQTHDLPDMSGFAAAPEILLAGPALAIGATSAHVRPAAFSPATALPLPGVPAPVTETPATEVAQTLSPFGLPCGLDVTAEATDAAMIALGIAAPCHPDAVVTITHSGMSIRQRTDAVGLMTLDLPALETPAFVTVSLPDGSESDILVPVPELADYDRVALAWRGDLGVELHVMEDGASWMSEGHVHPGAPRGPEAVGNGAGFLAFLGNPDLDAPMMAQVYTMPRGTGPTRADISVDAPITADNCARAAEARVLHVQGAGRAEVVPLGLTYPGCDAVGDTLVLQNVFRDLRLAAN